MQVIPIKNLDTIMYGLHTSPFGVCLIGIHRKGVCYLSFLKKDDLHVAKTILATAWPHANLVCNDTETKKYIKQIFTYDGNVKKLPLIVRGTKFQLNVWNALLAIPKGKTSTYSEIAKKIGTPKAFRAVGTACGKNSIGYLIPCHRVLATNGMLSGYRWGTDLKKTMLKSESVVGSVVGC